jgi:predicted nucleic acid-binding protein
MIVTFDTNVLVYATTAFPDAKAVRARELIERGMRRGSSVLLLQALAEFSSVATRKMGIPAAEVRAMIEAWQSVCPVRAAEEDDLLRALEAVGTHKLSFWDAMLWAAARRVGVRHFMTEELQDRFELDGVIFLNPFRSVNETLIDEILPPK